MTVIIEYIVPDHAASRVENRLVYISEFFIIVNKPTPTSYSSPLTQTLNLSGANSADFEPMDLRYAPRQQFVTPSRRHKYVLEAAGEAEWSRESARTETE